MSELNNIKIDFVLIWVDGNDSKWQKEYRKYKNEDGDQSATRFRDMGTLQYWFRGVERFAPWVNKIYFVTCGQRPEWLNVKHPKLICVDHKDFIPEQYLPTFSSHCIELNIHRIKGLSEHFVYFNDDTFIVSPMHKEDFFKNGLPCDSAVINYAAPRNEPINLVPFVNTALINRHFTKSEVIKKNFSKFYTPIYGKYLIKNIQFAVGKWFPGFKYFHQPSSFLKTVFEEVWQAEPEKLNETSMHKFRVLTDVNQWLMQDWQICTGRFSPRDPNIGYYGTVSTPESLRDSLQAIKSRKYKLVCPNDAGYQDFDEFRSLLIKALDELMPKKSKFEL
ncbi:MAG: Stealth CR1 domain-containing protein [Ruminococcus sp.]|nr:Stealth CR1 domain-containing protein [Ruminococcus sp.]